MPYDWASGLVFDETAVPSKHQAHCTADLEVRRNRVGFPSPRSLNAANTLYDMAMQKLLSNVECLEQNALEGVPSAMLDRIWRAAVRS